MSGESENARAYDAMFAEQEYRFTPREFPTPEQAQAAAESLLGSLRADSAHGRFGASHYRPAPASIGRYSLEDADEEFPLATRGTYSLEGVWVRPGGELFPNPPANTPPLVRDDEPAGILDRIDAATGCQYCSGPLGASVSDDFCCQDHQQAWHREHDPLGAPAYAHPGGYMLNHDEGEARGVALYDEDGELADEHTPGGQSERETERPQPWWHPDADPLNDLRQAAAQLAGETYRIRTDRVDIELTLHYDTSLRCFHCRVTAVLTGVLPTVGARGLGSTPMEAVHSCVYTLSRHGMRQVADEILREGAAIESAFGPLADAARRG